MIGADGCPGLWRNTEGSDQTSFESSDQTSFESSKRTGASLLEVLPCMRLFQPMRRWLSPTMESAVSSVSPATHKQGEAAIQQARLSLEKQASAAKTLPERAQKAIVAKVTAMQETVEAGARKKDEALQASKVKELTEATQQFSKEDLEAKDIDFIKAEKQKVNGAEKAAGTAISDAKRAMAEKARESRSSGALSVALAQMQSQITSGQPSSPSR